LNPFLSFFHFSVCLSIFPFLCHPFFVLEDAQRPDCYTRAQNP
jgi:hypothetical protein